MFKKAGIIFLILAVLLVYMGYKKQAQVKKIELKKVTLSEAGQQDAYQEITGFSLEEYLSGRKKIEIKAEKATIKPKRIGFLQTPLVKETHMSKPEIIFFTNGKKSSHITADSGNMNMANKKIFMEGDVVMMTADGKRLSAKEMTIDPKNGLLYIRGSYTLKSNGKIVNSSCLKTDVELKNL